MKKLFCCLLFLMPVLMACKPLKEHSQRHTDLSIRIISPVEGQEIPFGDTVKIIISIKNLGPAAIERTDTVFYQVVAGCFGHMIAGRTIPVGDSFVYNPYLWTNGVSKDSSFTACAHIGKHLNTNFINTNQRNDSSCVTFILKAKKRH